MMAEFLQIGFLALAVIAVALWAERPAKRKHTEGCDICARRKT